ncbi:MAG: diadenylate cyclase CdaA [Sphaerochaetaceae bacterium]|nr:diadenylate cyclase CdaA [Sphaerochaetaceae bacterium]
MNSVIIAVYRWIVPVIEVSVLTYLLYQFHTALLQTKAQQIARIMLYYLSLYIISYLMRLETLLFLFEHVTIVFIIFVLIVYQPELRRAFTQLFSGQNRLIRLGAKTTSEQIDIILNACNVLISKNRGALIVFTRHLGVKGILDTGTRLNADLSSALLLTIFDHDTPLHDGAVVISGGKIQAAGVYLPLSEQTSIKKSFGTRHRAALGLAEESDAIVLVVSEETGRMSLTYNANILYDLSPQKVKQMLLGLFSYHDVDSKDGIEEAGINENE